MSLAIRNIREVKKRQNFVPSVQGKTDNIVGIIEPKMIKRENYARRRFGFDVVLANCNNIGA